MLVIVVVGLARSGKDTVAKYLVEKHGFKQLDFFRDVIVPLMKSHGLEITKANAASFGNEMRAKYGMGVFGKKIAELMKGYEKVVVTGARSPEELTPIEALAERFHILRVEAPKELRFSRRTELDPQSREEFFARDKNDIENKGLGKVLELADLVIVNNSTLDELYKAIDELMEKL
ncbi:MAG: hypothetical protein J7J87_01275 [Candidatus Diapherotrites archaeon]|nr:hypothetical protein [Candidatus Diapherotrites archaeon]